MRSLFRTVILVFTFFAAFFLATIISDMIDKYSGYYNQGIQEANEVGK
jgi:hypothetical protein